MVDCDLGIEIGIAGVPARGIGESSGYRILRWSTCRFLISPSGNCTRNETGPIWSRTFPVTQVGAPVKFRR